jgi:hypothetical protein
MDFTVVQALFILVQALIFPRNYFENNLKKD